MLILIFCLALFNFVMFQLLRYKYSQNPNDDTLSLGSTLSLITAVGIFIAICCLAPQVASERVIDQKIAMYQEENAKIEQDIDVIVQKYLEHEHNTFAELKAEESSITYVALLPELKSDALVQQQLDIFVANNEEIKALKKEKIELATYRWLIYFGK